MLPPEQVARAIETLERNARWLTQIVEDVLDVSRIVSGKIRLDVQAVILAGFSTIQLPPCNRPPMPRAFACRA
jgi:K+-sensing histidine kinase KdpD